MTPKRLALWGLALIGAWLALAVVIVLIDVASSSADVASHWWWVLLTVLLLGVGALALIGAGLAKIIEIGVRAGRR